MYVLLATAISSKKRNGQRYTTDAWFARGVRCEGAVDLAEIEATPVSTFYLPL
jgi:hypothetical protein